MTPDQMAELAALLRLRARLFRAAEPGSVIAGDMIRAADLIESMAQAEPVAVRHNFDGHGWLYLDNGSGSDWFTRHADGEPLYAAPQPAPIPAGWRDAVAGLVDDIDGLIGESTGVYGLHLNGDPSPWDELTEGGRFERLTHLEQVRSMLAAAPKPGDSNE